MPWCFAKVNNRLAEIYFEETKNGSKIIGHCYIKLSEYYTKRENNWITEDTKKFQFAYKDGEYKKVQNVI